MGVENITHSNARKKIIFSIMLMFAMFIVGVIGFRLISQSHDLSDAIWITVNI